MLIVGRHCHRTSIECGGCIFKGKKLISFGKVKLRSPPFKPGIDHKNLLTHFPTPQRMLIMCHSSSAEVVYFFSPVLQNVPSLLQVNFSLKF